MDNLGGPDPIRRKALRAELPGRAVSWVLGCPHSVVNRVAVSSWTSSLLTSPAYPRERNRCLAWKVHSYDWRLLFTEAREGRPAGAKPEPADLTQRSGGGEKGT